MLSLFVICSVVCIYNGASHKNNISLLLANVEALAGDIPESQEFKCYIHKDKCVVSAGTATELESLNKIIKKLGGIAVKLNVSVDVSDATCLYSTDPSGPKVRCGQDVRCADVWKK